ncbi:hypothetical protein TGPRC2_268660 [Toxoplasma gondii TgCatPRC2]|uniref:Uncharacterized protein n=15 Tax=Toxoplasma gondii TaxID=5811 RepID=B9PH26_TOXGV|nr:hypothetical protein TGME49_268660 [Toxoplasma gondii ME49]EPR64846.1 hypothetical protein TGGT1_268660 [Toxoplasma gondii GT1]ESS36316.1 hypothetical protein TGVEG_268660 [Toxoplasma gondii VEG]KFG39173.1 hypothetical protein TGDOM2_268660 [Toxoplasma gondii GAB2-2007-GAL-DOM2]KFG52504.1 hypothetical protein TGP89_268660 [Toxoplasma gondii p89]KFG54584.1 hypothetical protein TGFOU_268660 [Toxoplasma gondii FOU]KFG61417.1 hypothetical protein TGRUB_268660 [Toxoplasma gondii RUB]KFH06181.1|eukprot:XP_002365559.1 hypothetical protein TGME49_268660 [Toxoplasma gondii ME49]
MPSTGESDTGGKCPPSSSKLPELRVSSPKDQPASSPYMDPSTGKAIPIEKGDWRRTGVPPTQPQADGESQCVDGKNVLDPNQLDFRIERQESRLPEEEEIKY